MRGAIGVDFDGVIADTGETKRRWIARNYGVFPVSKRSDKTSLLRVIGRDLYKKMQCEVGFDDTLCAAPILDSVDSLKLISCRYDVVVITARPDEKIPWVRQWLEDHGVSDCVAAVVSSFGCKKLDLLAKMRCIAIVDDDIRHLQVAHEYEGRRILFGGESSSVASRRENLYGVVSVECWKSVVSLFFASGCSMQC